MTKEIKQRIEQIKNGEVPQGYKKTKIGIVPNEWEICKAKNVFKNVSDKNHKGELEVLSVTQDRGVIPRSHVDIDIKYDFSNVVNYKKVERGDFVISLRSFQGGIEYSDYTGLVSPAYTVLKNIRDIKSMYYKMYFKSDNYIKQLNVAVYGIRDGKQISYDDFGFIEIPYPPLNEQQKISDILLTQDKVIELKEKLLKEKEKQKKYLMQNLLTARKRLKGFNGEWKKVKLGEICDTITDYVASGSFADIRKNVKYESTINYAQLIRTIDLKSNFLNNDFIYVSENAFNYLWKVNLDKESIILPNVGNCGEVYYITPKDLPHKNNVLGPNAILVRSSNCNNKFLNFIFKDKQFQYELQKIIALSGQTKFNKTEFKEIEILLPSIEEQKAIAEILTTADKELKLLQEELEEEKRKKKALMQLLLTGIVRVKV